MECFTFLRNVTDLLLMGRPHVRDVLGNHVKDRSFHLVHGWVLPDNCEGPVKNPSIWKESLTWIVPRLRIVRGGEFGRVTYWSQTLRSWRRWTHQKSVRKDSMRKRWHFPNMENLFFLSQMDESKPLEEIRNWEHPPRPIEGESIIDFLGESEGSLPQPHDSLPDAGEAMNDFWSMSGSFIYRHHVEPRVKLYSPREESFPIPLKTLTSPELHTQIWMLSKSAASMIIGTSMGQEMCLTIGQVSLSSLYWMKNQIFVFREEINKKTADIQDRSFMARTLGENGKAKVVTWKNQNSMMQEEFISLTLRTRNSRRQWRMPARNWKYQWLPLCFARWARTVRIGWLVGEFNEIKSKLACILEASESTRLRMVESLPNHHEDHILGKGANSLQHYNLVHKFIPMLQAMKISTAVDKEWENWRKFRFGTWRKSEVRKKWSMKQGRKAQKFISPHWRTYVIWKMLNLMQSIRNAKVELYSEAML